MTVCKLCLNKKAKNTHRIAMSVFAIHIYYLAFASLYLTHNGPDTNNEDTQPDTRPNAIGIAKERSEVRPQTSATTTIVRTAQTVVVVVTMLRTSVLDTLKSILSESDILG